MPRANDHGEHRGLLRLCFPPCPVTRKLSLSRPNVGGLSLPSRCRLPVEGAGHGTQSSGGGMGRCGTFAGSVRGGRLSTWCHEAPRAVRPHGGVGGIPDHTAARSPRGGATARQASARPRPPPASSHSYRPAARSPPRGGAVHRRGQTAQDILRGTHQQPSREVVAGFGDAEVRLALAAVIELRLEAQVRADCPTLLER